MDCRADVPKIIPKIYLDGVFDLFHASHLAFISSAIAHATAELKCPTVHVVCGVISDRDAESYKRTPVWNERQRATMLQHCTLVDTVVPNSPLVVTDAFLDRHDISLVYHANDSKQEDFFARAIARRIMRYIPYDTELSTTAIIHRIKTQY